MGFAGSFKANNIGELTGSVSRTRAPEVTSAINMKEHVVRGRDLLSFPRGDLSKTDGVQGSGHERHASHCYSNETDRRTHRKRLAALNTAGHTTSCKVRQTFTENTYKTWLQTGWRGWEEEGTKYRVRLPDHALRSRSSLEESRPQNESASK